ncbi:hypothetical protein [Peterkaempfera griseoplana]|uniref:hypothetical protein n=1 Tax=Peterkaempfera griseoplana TaxID=66896 RepID=UPI0006E171AB|nr:hypothetical protein [Peterkaempfera griseoplana]
MDRAHAHLSTWAKAPLAAGAALLLTLAVPTSAWAANGTVSLTVVAANGATEQLNVTNPTDGHCYTVQEVAPHLAGATFQAVTNNTDKVIDAYANLTCSSFTHAAIRPGGSISGIGLSSFRPS